MNNDFSRKSEFLPLLNKICRPQGFSLLTTAPLTIKTSSKNNYQIKELFEIMAYKAFFQQQGKWDSDGEESINENDYPVFDAFFEKFTGKRL
jgi:hypothetical protein